MLHFFSIFYFVSFRKTKQNDQWQRCSWKANWMNSIRIEWEKLKKINFMKSHAFGTSIIHVIFRHQHNWHALALAWHAMYDRKYLTYSEKRIRNPTANQTRSIIWILNDNVNGWGMPKQRRYVPYDVYVACNLSFGFRIVMVYGNRFKCT